MHLAAVIPCMLAAKLRLSLPFSIVCEAAAENLAKTRIQPDRLTTTAVFLTAWHAHLVACSCVLLRVVAASDLAKHILTIYFI